VSKKQNFWCKKSKNFGVRKAKNFGVKKAKNFGVKKYPPKLIMFYVGFVYYITKL